jgi:hypothetical protein
MRLKKAFAWCQAFILSTFTDAQITQSLKMNAPSSSEIMETHPKFNRCKVHKQQYSLQNFTAKAQTWFLSQQQRGVCN